MGAKLAFVKISMQTRSQSKRVKDFLFFIQQMKIMFCFVNKKHDSAL